MIQGESPEEASAEEQNEGAVHPFMARSYVNGSTVEEILRFTLQQAYDTTHAVAEDIHALIWTWWRRLSL